jgi:hypothetical protein
MPRSLEQIDAALESLQSAYAADTTPSRAELANMQATLYTGWQTFVDQLRAKDNGVADYESGPVNGVPQPDPGWYPLTDPAGLTTWHPSIARLRVEASELRFETRTLTSGSTHLIALEDTGMTLSLIGTTATSNINARMPTTARTGWCVNLIQMGSGGPRVTITIPTATDGSALAFLRQRGSAFRLANQYALATVICTGRDSSGRPTFVCGGDLVQ